MSTAKKAPLDPAEIPSALASYLGVRRTMTLRRIMRQSGLPMEVVLDLALELLDIASRKLAPTPLNRQAVGLGTARWRNVGPEERSEALRRAAQARWAKPRGTARDEKNQSKK
jgi:hypothetical protein